MQAACVPAWRLQYDRTQPSYARMQPAYERMKPAYWRNAGRIMPVCRMQHAAACCTTLVCRLLQPACRLQQRAFARMQAAAGITRMHMIAFWKMHVVGEMMYATARLPTACSSDLRGERNFVTMSNSYRILIWSAIVYCWSIILRLWHGRAVVFDVGVQFVAKLFPRNGIESSYVYMLPTATPRAKQCLGRAYGK